MMLDVAPGAMYAREPRACICGALLGSACATSVLLEELDAAAHGLWHRVLANLKACH